MTLTSTIAIHDPLPVREVYEFARNLLGTPQHVVPIRSAGFLGNPLGIGLPALMWVDYHEDGPMLQAPPPSEDEEDRQWREKDPTSNGWAALALRFDTAYGYRAGNGAGCADLHVWLIREVGRWLDGRGKAWQWYVDTHGEWTRGYDGLDEVGDVNLGALQLADSSAL